MVLALSNKCFLMIFSVTISLLPTNFYFYCLEFIFDTNNGKLFLFKQNIEFSNLFIYFFFSFIYLLIFCVQNWSFFLYWLTHTGVFCNSFSLHIAQICQQFFERNLIFNFFYFTWHERTSVENQFQRLISCV